MLESFESEASRIRVNAPLIFIPLEIKEQDYQDFRFSGNDEARVNVLFLSKLKEVLISESHYSKRGSLLMKMESIFCKLCPTFRM
jgi:hypothetical protein